MHGRHLNLQEKRKKIIRRYDDIETAAAHRDSCRGADRKGPFPNVNEMKSIKLSKKQQFLSLELLCN